MVAEATFNIADK